MFFVFLLTFIHFSFNWIKSRVPSVREGFKKLSQCIGILGRYISAKEGIINPQQSSGERNHQKRLGDQGGGGY